MYGQNMRKKVQAEVDGASFLVDSRYKILSTLGKGSYGTVCSAIDTKTQGEKHRGVPIAIKKVSNIFDRPELLKRSLRELKLMRHFRGHKNIVNLLDLDIVSIQPFEGLYCVQELIDLDLSKVIYSGIQFSEFHIQNFIYQILCGLKYIHSADVIHRDLKPGNILVTIQGTLKICDFGLARGVSPKFLSVFPTPITNYVATRWYRAPELMLSKGMYSKSIDLWAIGCIAAELYGRKPLFMGKDQLDQLQRIFKVIGPPEKRIIKKYNWKITNSSHLSFKGAPFSSMYIFASAEALNLLENLLTWDAEDRLTVTEALSHTFFEFVRDPGNEAECRSPFDFSFEDPASSAIDLKRLLQREVHEFKRIRMNPD